MQINVDDETLNYEIIGKGTPILFLHGLGNNLESMQMTYEPLFDKQKFQRIYLDLPGMGQSKEMHNDKPTSDWILGVVSVFIDKILGSSHYYLVGHSYGGYLALGLAYRNPKQITKLFLTCPAVTANRERRLVAEHTYFQPKPFKVKEKDAASFAQFLTEAVVITKASWKVYQERVSSRNVPLNHEFIEELRSENFLHYTLSFEHRMKTQAFEVPTIMLLGRRDQIVGFEEQLGMAKNFKYLTLHLADRAGHRLTIDQPGIVKHYFEQFLDNDGV